MRWKCVRSALSVVCSKSGRNALSVVCAQSGWNALSVVCSKSGQDELRVQIVLSEINVMNAHRGHMVLTVPVGPVAAVL